ncbi:MafB family polymorphic toxin [Neisseria sp.]|uniref:MafB family polymorphic toxin n=1 Tax=Neisseria sp. TaxID=192066 RepID=UPI0026DCB3F1|nr:MafB family polymorphic toxin [Neisseria sp.]MDO4907240.1 MafB family polymorphic toxin [Neisseria sp.]
MKKLLRKPAAFLAAFAVAAAALVQPAAAADLGSDPFIRQNTDRKNFEPGGQYHLFGSRGSVTDRTGSITVNTVSSQRIGNLQMEHAVIKGDIGYTVRFSGHGHEVHAPFDNHGSRSAGDSKGNVGIDLTTYSLRWTGHEHHPADGYDGPQGGGYPAPTGARDEYRYTINGAAAKVNVNVNDYRSTAERFADRLTNARDMAGSSLKNAWETATAPNEALDWRGQTARAVNAALSGAAGVAAAGWEAIGAGDAADGLSTLKAVAGLEAIRALPPAAQLKAVEGLGSAASSYDNAYSRAEAAYNNWAQRNPNAAEAVGVAATVGRYAVERGMAGKSSGSTIQNRHGGGRNDKHQNLSARQSAERNLARAESNLSDAKQRGLSKKELKTYERQVKHWRDKMNQTGETHGRRHKGNR